MPLVEARARLGHQLEHRAVELHDLVAARAQHEPGARGERRQRGRRRSTRHEPVIRRCEWMRQAALEAQEEVLAVGVDRAHRAAREALGPAVAREARVRRLERVGHVALEHRADAVRGVVDRVALGHGAQPRSRSTIARTLTNARGWSRDGVSAARVAAAGRRARRASPPAGPRARTRGGRSCPCPSRATQRTAPRPARTIRPSTGGRLARRAEVERRRRARPRRARGRSAGRRARRFTRGTAASAPRWSACAGVRPLLARRWRSARRRRRARRCGAAVRARRASRRRTRCRPRRAPAGPSRCGDQHDEAGGGRVEDADDVARAAVAGHAEAVVGDAQAGRPEALLDPRVRATLGGGARGARPAWREGERSDSSVRPRPAVGHSAASRRAEPSWCRRDAARRSRAERELPRAGAEAELDQARPPTPSRRRARRRRARARGA